LQPNPASTTISGSATASYAQIFSSGNTWTGTSTAIGGAVVTGLYVNQYDSLIANGTSAGLDILYLASHDTTLSTGNRNVGVFIQNYDATSASTSLNTGGYTGLISKVAVHAAAPFDHEFGLNSVASADSNLGSLLEIVSYEADIGLGTNDTPQRKEGIQVIELAGDASAGTLDDCAFCIGGQTATSIGFGVGLELEEAAGQTSYNTLSHLIDVGQAVTVGSVIDTHLATCVNNDLLMENFSVSCAGQATLTSISTSLLTVGGGVISPSSGSTLATAGAFATTLTATAATSLTLPTTGTMTTTAGSNITDPQTFRKSITPVGDGISVTDFPYNAVQDCAQGFPQATWSNNTNTLTAVTQTATWAITSGNTTVSFSSGTYTNTYFSPDDVGKPFAVAGITWNGGNATTTIAKWINGNTILTSTTPDQSLSASANAIWPAFLASMVGKVARIDWAQPETHITYGVFNLAAPLLAQVQTVTSPFQIVVYSQAISYVGGSYTAGDSLSVSFASSGITGSPISVSYTLISGDNWQTVAQGLAANINANSALSAAGIFASANYGQLKIYWPGTLATLTLGRTNGTGVTLTNPLTSTQNGLGGSNVPVPTLAPTRVWVGTDNTAAISAAAVAAVNNPGSEQRVYYLNFPNKRNGFAYCAFGMAPVYANTNGPGANNSHEWNEMVIPQGDDGVVDGFTDASGQIYPVHIVPRVGPTPPPPRQTVSGSKFKRIAGAAAPIISAWGASKCSSNGGGSEIIDFSTTYLLANAIQKANSGKTTLPATDTCLGGQPWQAMDPTGTQIPVVSKWPNWYVTHTNTWGSYAKAPTISQYGATGKTPDFLYLGALGTNDEQTISDNSILNVINYVKGWTADSFGNPPDIVMATIDQYPTIGGGDSLGNFRGYYVSDNNNYEYASQLVRDEAVANGIDYLDFGTQIHLLMDGWSPQYETLSPIPNMPTTAITNGVNYWIRDYTHDFSFDLLLGTSGTSGTTFWNSNTTHVYVQVGRRPDNILDISTNSAGYLQIQENVQGGTCTAPVTNSASTGTLSVGTTGQSSVSVTNSLNNYGFEMAQGSYISSSSNSLASAGQFILIPGANHPDIDGGVWRGLVLDHNGFNYALDGGAPNTLSSTSMTATVGGCPFMADDTNQDIIVPGAGAAGADFTSRIASVSSQTGIVMRDTPSTVQSAVSQNLWIGRIGIPLQNTPGNNNGHTFVSNVLAGTDSGDQPQLYITVQSLGSSDQLVIGYERASDAATNNPIQPIYRGPMVRWGGPFYPRIWLANAPSGTQLQAINIRTDHPTIFHRNETSRYLFGSQVDGTDMNSNNEFSAENIAQVWVPVIAAQNWAAPGVPPVSSALLSSGSTATAYCGQTLAVEDTTSPTITLPASCPSWAQVTVADVGRNAGSHAITLTAPSGTVLNGASGGSATITTAGQHAVITYDGGLNAVSSIN
jgi:hypothetical protein